MAKKQATQPLSLFGESFGEKKSHRRAAARSVKKSAQIDPKTGLKARDAEKAPSERTSSEKTKRGFESTEHLLERFQVVPVNKAISHEFQSFGCYLAETLGDLAHTSLYIRLAKSQSRAVLEQALRFVVDSQARNKAKLFMWKLQQVKLQQQQKQQDQKPFPAKGEQ